MAARKSRSTAWATAAVTAALCLGTGAAPARADATLASAAADPVVNGGFVMSSDYLGLDGVVRVLPEPFDPDWSFITSSPDGAALAFTTPPGSPTDDDALWVIPSGGAPQEVAMLGDGVTEHLAWSPGGTMIATEGFLWRRSTDTYRSFVYLVDVSDHSVRTLVDTGWANDIHLDGLTWAPDSSRIAVAAVDETSWVSDLRWVDAASGAATSVTHLCAWSGWTADCTGSPEQSGFSHGVDLSPDGTTFLSGDDHGMLSAIDSTTGEARALGLAGETPVWSPDGARFAYTSSRKQSGLWQNVTYTAAADGSDPRLETVNLRGIADWQPCTSASCPTFGSPRGTARMGKVSSSHTARYLDVAMTIQPAGPQRDYLEDGPVVLQRRTTSGWKAVYKGATEGANGYTYELRLPRPAPGKCRLKLNYLGDPWTEPAKLTTPQMAC